MNSFNKKLILIAIISFLLGYLAQGYLFTFKNIPRGVDKDEFALFWDVWKTMEEKYPFEEPTEEEKRYDAIKGLVASYGDRHSSFFPPEGAQIFQETVSGKFGGAGMEINISDGYLVVISPLKDSPAEKAGFIAGDVITHIDLIDVHDRTLNAVTSLIRGEVGTEVTMTILRAGEENSMDLTLTREIVQIPVLDTDIIDDAFVLSLYNFNEDSDDKFKEALEEFKSSGLKHLLIDVRNNPGGLLNASIEMASYLLDQGKVIVTEDFGDSGREKNTHRSKGYPLLKDNKYSIGVIINRGSASASEILAGALRDNNRSIIIGEQSFGKGSMQELIDLDQETSLRVTIGKWLTPNGKHISGEGISPDVNLQRTSSNHEFIKEAVKILKNS